MSSLGKKILKLRQEGKTYNQIKEELNCSKGIVSYYCGENQREKTRRRTRKRRKQHPFVVRIDRFLGINKKQKTLPTKSKYSKNKIIRNKIEHFHIGKDKMYVKPSFNYQDVIDKFGENPKCYLTGDDIDINKINSYHFDHIIPASRGGDNSLENLGICSRRANLAKGDMTPDELLHFCKKILEFNDYKVQKK